MSVQAPKLQKTTADFLVIGISPVLIMALVGSLVFFLTEVLYRGEAPLAIQWVLFWFVIAIVLVSRMGIELGPLHATGYGLALAAATWLYLAVSHNEHVVGLVLLATTWWCARQLTRDCTLVDDDEDTTQEGVLDAVSSREQDSPSADSTKASEGRGRLTRRCGRRKSPGGWVVYFSLGALPLFAVGQVILPERDIATRRLGFLYVAVYLSAALGLLLTTSFLTLRRYLRQRRLQMPAQIGFRWFGSGMAVALAVLAAALLLPRPGADYTWKSLAAAVDESLRSVSESFAGNGSKRSQVPRAGGQSGEGSISIEESVGSDESDNLSAGHGGQQTVASSSINGSGEPSGAESDSGRWNTAVGAGAKLHNALRAAVIIAGIALVTWALWRGRRALREFLCTALEHLKRLLNVFASRRARRLERSRVTNRSSVNRPLQSPFASGLDRVWPAERLVTHTHRALQEWARGRGMLEGSDPTASELCLLVAESNSAIADELQSLSYYYGHVAYGRGLPFDYDARCLHAIWRLLDANTPEGYGSST